MRTEQLTEDDWETLRDIRLKALKSDATAVSSSLERESGFKESHWRMRLRTTPTFVLRTGDRVVGLIGVIRGPGAPAEERHLTAQWVDPEHRGHGAAQALLAAAEDWAVHDGASLISFWLVDGYEATDLYLGAGYAPTGVRMPVPRDRSLTEERWTKSLVSPE